MAWSTPATWVAGAVLTAAQLNAQLRDNLNAAFPLAVDAWTAYTPTLTQSATVTKTVTYAKYQRVGRLIVVQGNLAVTGAGTAANAVTVGLPVTAAVGGFMVVGSGYIQDASAGAVNYSGIAVLASTTTMVFANAQGAATNGLLGVGGFAAALAAGDVVTYAATYESAT